MNGWSESSSEHAGWSDSDASSVQSDDVAVQAEVPLAKQRGRPRKVAAAACEESAVVIAAVPTQLASPWMGLARPVGDNVSKAIARLLLEMDQPVSSSVIKEFVARNIRGLRNSYQAIIYFGCQCDLFIFYQVRLIFFSQYVFLLAAMIHLTTCFD